MDEGYKADLDEPDKFIPSDVNITQAPTNISNIMDRLENREFDLTPAFYFDASKEDEWIVIDGLQRLTAFQNYLVGNRLEDGLRKKNRFKGMQYLTDFIEKISSSKF